MPPAPQIFSLTPSDRNNPAGRSRDITWNRPVFRPPLLPNPRVIFDPLPFLAQRLTAATRETAGN